MCVCPSPSRASLPAGLWALSTSGVPRVQVRGVLGLEQLVLGSSDRFALGAAALGLRLCRPFLTGEPKHMRHLEPSYYSTSAYRCDRRCRRAATSTRTHPHTAHRRAEKLQCA